MLTLFSGSEVRDRESLVQAVAREVARVVREQLTAKTSGMSAAELRGYLRIRAASEARAGMRRAISDFRLPQSEEAELTAAVLERVIHLVIRDVFVRPVVAIPAAHVRLREAA